MPVPDASLAMMFGGVAIAVAALYVAGTTAASRRLGEPPALRRRVAIRASLASLGWMALTGAVAASGVLARQDIRPPPILAVFAATVVVVLVVGRSRAGTRLVHGLPLAALVGVQAFRLPLELAMHAAARAGALPEQMTFTGTNFDIATGILAIPLAIVVARRHPASRRLVAIWNVLGIALLANVVVTAIVSTPVIHAFGTEPRHVNTFITRFPFVWLVTICVAAAASGHILVARSLRASQPGHP